MICAPSLTRISASNLFKTSERKSQAERKDLGEEQNGMSFQGFNLF